MRLFRRATATPNSKYPTKVGCVFQLPSIALMLRQKGHMLLRKGVVAGQHQHNPLDCSTASGQRYNQAARHILCHSSQQLPGSGDVQTQQQSVKLPTELQGFRPNVGMCVFHPQKGVFAATRVDDPGKSWQMPQGGIDPGEDPQAAALRELFEETCIRSAEVVAELPRWLPYEFPTSVRCKLQGTWAQYKGQAQRWFLLKFTGDDSEIDLDTEHKEFDGWRWMPLEQLPDTVIAFKQDVYREVVAEFQPIIDRLVSAQ